MAVPIPLGYLRSRSASGNRMDVVLQSRTSKYGIGRIHPKTAAGHGCIALLLLSTVKNGGITPSPPSTSVDTSTADAARAYAWRATNDFVRCASGWPAGRGPIAGVSGRAARAATWRARPLQTALRECVG